MCGKGKTVGHHRKLLRGNYNVTGKRTFTPNLQKTKFEGRNVLACVKCIRNETRKAQQPAKSAKAEK